VIGGVIGFAISAYFGGDRIERAMAASGSVWELMGMPPGGAKEIAFSSPGVVFVTGMDQAKYRCQWVISDGACHWDLELPPEELEMVSNCPSPWPDIPNPPGDVLDSSEHVDCYGEGVSQTNYAVLSDGSVWRWKHGSNAMGMIAAILIVVGAGTIAGILIGIVVASVLWVST